MDADAAARPRFKSCVEPVVDANDGLFLLSEGAPLHLAGPLFAALAPLLDGRHDAVTIFGRLSEDHEPADVRAALEHLRDQGLLADDTAALPRAYRAWWERQGAAPGAASRRLAGARVTLTNLGGFDAAPLVQALSAEGVQVVAGHAADLGVVLTDHPLHPGLAALNARCLADNQPWLLAMPVGMPTWLGPAFVPGQTACWECLAQRLRWHHRVAQHLGSPGAPPAHLHSTLAAALADTATELLRWLGSGTPGDLADAVITCEPRARTRHALVRRPQCPACGHVRACDGRQALPLELQARPRAPGSSDGGHRAATAADTLQLLERHLSPVTGLVATLQPGERGGDSSLVATFSAEHNFSDMADRRFFLREGLRRRSGGKGKTALQARTSALAESLERYCGVFDGSEPRVRARSDELAGSAIHPNAVMHYSARQYAQRAQHNQRQHKAWWVPEPFAEDASIDWTPLWSLTDACTRHLPTSLCWFGYPAEGPVFARADSNGCAAGAVHEEAVLQGLLELIERDAVALWWYSRVQRRGVDLAGADDPYAAALVQHYRGLRRSLWVLDLSSDLGVPCFAALSARTDSQANGGAHDILYGFGCHLDPQIALSRALTELNQSLEAVPLAGGGEAASDYRGNADALRWWHEARTDNQRWLLPSADAPAAALQDFADASSSDLRDDIAVLVQRLRERHIEVLVLDQTRPDVGLPVVRVVAPGLRHFWARFGPGRLYDVPVQQGWLARPLTESELNPFVVQF